MGAPRVLVVQHVPWEGPHRIGSALEAAGVRLLTRRPLDGDQLPALDDVDGAVFMGGPMNVDEIERYPALLAERKWLTEAVAAELPVLGVCLGAQLIARAAGAEIRTGPAPEIGWAPVWVHDAEDPVVGALAPGTPVLHWHGDIFDLPPGATHLASSDRTAIQAFRVRNAWGLLFHAEADDALTELWLGESSMRDEAAAALGTDGPSAISAGAREFAPQLVAASAPGFAAFAELVNSRDSG